MPFLHGRHCFSSFGLCCDYHKHLYHICIHNVGISMIRSSGIHISMLFCKFGTVWIDWSNTWPFTGKRRETVSIYWLSPLPLLTWCFAFFWWAITHSLGVLAFPPLLIRSCIHTCYTLLWILPWRHQYIWPLCWH